MHTDTNRRLQRRLRSALAGLLASAALTACSIEPADPFASNEDEPLVAGTDRTPDGAPSWTSMTSWWTGDEPETTFGIDVCIRRDSDVRSVTLTGVEPYESVGEVEQLGSRLIESTDPGDLLISLEGFPPRLSSAATFEHAVGHEFTYRCGEEKNYQQIVIGLRGFNEVGGGWEGATVRYQVDGREYAVNVPVGMFMCGTSTAACGEEP